MALQRLLLLACHHKAFDCAMEPDQVGLCLYCIKLTTNEPTVLPQPDPTYIEHWRGLPQIQHWRTLAHLQSSSHSCSICNILLGGFDEKRRSPEFPTSRNTAAEQYLISLKLFNKTSPSSRISYKFIAAGIKRSNDYQDYWSWSWSFCIATCESQDAGPELMSKAWNSIPSSFETKISKMRDYLHVCESSHSHCGPRWHVRLPQRLVDLGVNDSATIKLVSTASLESRNVRYTALRKSPEQTILRTTRANVAAYHQEIPYFKLPQAYLNAALIAKKLGLRYIWIDSLCESNDWSDYWKRVSTADVYAGSTLQLTVDNAMCQPTTTFAQKDSSLTPGWMRTTMTSVHPKYENPILIHIICNPYIPSAVWSADCHRNVDVTTPELIWSCRDGYFWESGLEYAQEGAVYRIPPIFGAFLPDYNWRRWVRGYWPRRQNPTMMGLVSCVITR